MENREYTYRAEAAKNQNRSLARDLAYALGVLAGALAGGVLLRVGLWTLFPQFIGTPLPSFVYEVWEFLQPVGMKTKEIVDMIAVR